MFLCHGFARITVQYFPILEPSQHSLGSETNEGNPSELCTSQTISKVNSLSKSQDPSCSSSVPTDVISCTKTLIPQSQTTSEHGGSQNSVGSTSSIVSSLCSEVALPAVNAALQMLDVSPIPKKKLKINTWMDDKFDRTVGVMKRLCELPDLPDTKKDESDWAETISRLQEKFQSPSVTNAERIQILTLLPKSWTNTKVADEFRTSLYMVKKARKLCREQGILATPNANLDKMY